MLNCSTNFYNKKGEFHIHTKFSDGELEIEEVLNLLKGNIDYFSITDHDYIDSSIYAAKIARKFGLESIIGVEVSSYYNGESIHVLGYFRSDERLEKLKKKLNEIRLKAKDRRFKSSVILCQAAIVYFNIPCLLKKISDYITQSFGCQARSFLQIILRVK